MASTRAGPAATAPPLRCGASEIHRVGWSTAGQLGCLVTAVRVACQFAAPAAASSSAPGAAARARKPGQRCGPIVTTRMGTASSTSGCTATAAPVSHPARAVLDADNARKACNNSPMATASSG